MEFEDWLAVQIEAAQPDWHFQLMWDRQPAEVTHPKYDFPDDDTLQARRAVQERIKRELQFIAYDCS